MAKPIDEKKYRAFLKLVGWNLKKSGFDYNLCDGDGKYLCTIKIIHSKSKKREVSASSVRKTEHEFKDRGWLWPPEKKSKNI
jgi:hypothetical protein